MKTLHITDANKLQLHNTGSPPTHTHAAPHPLNPHFSVLLAFQNSPPLAYPDPSFTFHTVPPPGSGDFPLWDESAVSLVKHYLI